MLPLPREWKYGVAVVAKVGVVGVVDATAGHLISASSTLDWAVNLILALCIKYRLRE